MTRERDKALRHRAIVVLALMVLMAVAAMPATATAPAPVIPVGAIPSGGEPPPVEPAPAEPPPEDAVDCLIGSSGTVGTLAAYPAPVVPADLIEPESPCRTEISLSLAVESPDGRRPEGADATSAGMSVPRPALEAGFDTTLPASSRTISLSDPGADWEVTDVGCTCGGSTASAQLASYPGPVIPVPSFDSGARPGSAACGAVGGSGASVASMASTMLGGPGVSDLATYPGPVIPVPGPAEPPTPPEPPPAPVNVAWDANGTVFIHDIDRLGGAITCAWTVELVYGDLILKTKTEPRGSEARFSYVVTPASSEHGATPTTMYGSPSGARSKLWSGAWSAEMQILDPRWELKRSSCDETDGSTSSSATGTSAQIGLDPGDKVTCTFEMKILAPKPGQWRARNGKGLVSCGVQSIKLPAVTDFGSLKVRQDGDLLIARGLSPGAGQAWRLHRDQADPRLYTGRVTLNLGGARGTFDTSLRMSDEKHMTGAFSGKVKVRGETCAFSRPLKLDYAGG